MEEIDKVEEEEEEEVKKRVKDGEGRVDDNVR